MILQKEILQYASSSMKPTSISLMNLICMIAKLHTDFACWSPPAIHLAYWIIRALILVFVLIHLGLNDHLLIISFAIKNFPAQENFILTRSNISHERKFDTSSNQNILRKILLQLSILCISNYIPTILHSISEQNKICIFLLTE